MIPDLIYDVGLNNGDDTAYYLKRGFRVVAIEADPKLATQVTERFPEEIRSERLKVLNVGIAAEEGDLPFWICETQPEWSSFDSEIASRDGSSHHQISIPCRRLSSILQEYGVPYYLKVDIEGNDPLCIEDLDRLHLPKFISVEALGVDLLSSLSEKGFKRFKCISQYHYLPLELPPTTEQRRLERADWLLKTRNPAIRAFRKLGGRKWIEQKASQTRASGGWRFPWGSSGPFGDELLGRWLSYAELRKVYEHYLGLQAKKKNSVFWTDKDYSFWTDFHARSD
jgi:FkbM family methyltransferase